ncbi:META domain-containing protein [Acinetobacter sp. ANC 4558]|uniref:META domain-containing protein n=1 Tax=Acinetobacter sp. ANC 4558 TaxID=1977876 RepID=UPI000A34EB43|nr:META domain-containing protein [Acinetobacter sp. ANC 4558]OTG85669.1 META domain-containing protein [Acinetobacter sp. ANC 4558]
MLKKLFAISILSSTLAIVGCQSTPSTSTNMTTTNLTLLQNTTWVATKIGNSTIVYNNDAANRASLQFDEANQRVTGTDGCNRLTGAYKAGKDTLVLDQLASTRMACMNNDNLDQKFNTALAKVTNYQVFGRTLKLLDRQGNPVIEFESVIQPR